MEGRAQALPQLFLSAVQNTGITWWFLPGFHLIFHPRPTAYTHASYPPNWQGSITPERFRPWVPALRAPRLIPTWLGMPCIKLPYLKLTMTRFRSELRRRRAPSFSGSENCLPSPLTTLKRMLCWTTRYMRCAPSGLAFSQMRLPPSGLLVNHFAPVIAWRRFLRGVRPFVNNWKNYRRADWSKWDPDRR